MAASAERGLAVESPVGKLLDQCRYSFYLAFWMSAALQFLKLSPMLYMLSIYDRVINTRSGITLVSMTVLMMGIYVFWQSIDWLRTRLLIRVSMRIDWDLAPEVFDASFRRHVKRQNVNVAQMMNDLVSIRQMLTGPALLALMDAPFAVLFIIVGYIFHPFLAVFITVASVLMTFSAYMAQRISSPILKAANDESAEAQRVAQASLRHAEASLALGMMPAIRRTWYARHKQFLEYTVNATEASGFVGGLSKFLSRALPSLQIGLGAWLAIEGEITGGMVVAGSMLITRAVSPIQALLHQAGSIVNARVAYARINKLLSEDRKMAAKMSLPAPKGKLDVLAAIGVPPGSNRAVVQDISFSVEPGQAVAIIGPSASGKTSLTRMLVGVWAPARGSVRLDGVEISEWNHDELGPHIGYVPQSVSFFEGTIAQNIARLGEVDPVKVVEAATLIGMHESILSLPEGYDTMLGESGFALSGGQKQRIGIARAFYGDPKYIVMDEPNASLDDVGENFLIEAISTLKERGVTFVVTTHRPRVVSVADNLLVLRAGRQVGYGPASEMINALRNLQSGGDAVPSPDKAVASGNVTNLAGR
ncbi:ATP-binding protein HasD [Sphingomonas sp. YR710]|uniref:type I secretion system permease/ATPase n=1 Tax=Sphingomonas sp. YR710 TaxID=1882773 RepID=UPI00088071A3|nr:type I secretion system permease/ATPase [Sphingomonas sp. YR710]SDD53992.1 ATP-binding protein HasD [Sphingomonas sp. YR710]